MANETQITLVGNLVEDVNLRFTPSGKAVANLRLASTLRVYDRQSGQWKDGDTLYMTCSIWGVPAENAADSLRKGNRVVVVGSLHQHEWQDSEGNRHTSFEVRADEIAVSLRSVTVTIRKRDQSGWGANHSSDYDDAAAGHRRPTNDPWASHSDEAVPF